MHNDYGATSDEPIQIAYGEEVWNYLAGHETYFAFCNSPRVPANIDYYNPALDLFCATLSHLFHADIYTVRHDVQGLLWMTMFLPVCALGRKIADKAGGWFAGLALMGMPGLFAHAFNNPKDLPLACAVIWLLYVSTSVASTRHLKWFHALKLGAAFGFVLLMRPGAWFLIVLVGLVPAACLFRAWKFWKIHRRWPLKNFYRAFPICVAAATIGWILMILPWPNAWHSPIMHPVASARLAAHFDEDYPVLLRGTIYHSEHLPWDYLASYLILTLPLPFLAFLIWGHLIFFRKFRRSVSAAVTILGIGFLIWFPLTVFVILRPNIYDGMRHFLFMLPPIAVLIGVAAADIAMKRRTIVIQIIIILLLLSAVPAMVRLHPYEVSYYNIIAGPNATLHERYETDYWLSGYREAAEWINKRQAETNRPLHVLFVAGDFNNPVFNHYLDKRVKTAYVIPHDFSDKTLSPDFDFYVAPTRYSQWLNFPSNPIVHRIERDGIFFMVIRGQPANPTPPPAGK
ncbi:MAG TPA: glycosyltransferase family 39 protein [Verrucomicrobiae bacterium]|nr:glycosyltransferase family 39 protein [Verrucomicrobiae bacterium]